MLKNYLSGIDTLNHQQNTENESIQEIYAINRNDYIKYEKLNDVTIKMQKFDESYLPDDMIMVIPMFIQVDDSELTIVDAEDDLFGDYQWAKIIIDNPKIMKKRFLNSLRTDSLILCESLKPKIYGKLHN